MKDASTYERSYGGRPEKYMKTVEKLVLFHNETAKDASATPKDTTPAFLAKLKGVAALLLVERFDIEPPTLIFQPNDQTL